MTKSVMLVLAATLLATTAGALMPLKARPTQEQPYYVVGRYACKDASDGRSRGDCTITSRSAQSCQDAHKNFDEEVRKRNGNPCRQCQMNEIDNSKVVAGGPAWIHEGPCKGQ
jgi:hypothetical protein